jgi:hypothetical protein
VKGARHGPAGREIAQARMRGGVPATTAEDQSKQRRDDEKGDVLLRADIVAESSCESTRAVIPSR